MIPNRASTTRIPSASPLLASASHSGKARQEIVAGFALLCQHFVPAICRNFQSPMLTPKPSAHSSTFPAQPPANPRGPHPARPQLHLALCVHRPPAIDAPAKFTTPPRRPLSLRFRQGRPVRIFRVPRHVDNSCPSTLLRAPLARNGLPPHQTAHGVPVAPSALTSAVPTIPVEPVTRIFMVRPRQRQPLACACRWPKADSGATARPSTSGSCVSQLYAAEPCLLPELLRRLTQSVPLAATAPGLQFTCANRHDHPRQGAVLRPPQGNRRPAGRLLDLAEGAPIEDSLCPLWRRLSRTRALSQFPGRLPQPGICRLDHLAHSGDEVAFLPPVSGG